MRNVLIVGGVISIVLGSIIVWQSSLENKGQKLLEEKQMDNLLVRERAEKVNLSNRVRISSENQKFLCLFNDSQSIYGTSIDFNIWSQAPEVVIEKDVTNGILDGPKAYVRTLWNNEAVFFYVEVESDEHEKQYNNDNELWMGPNIEFLISPNWHATPFYDEFELLFNSNQACNTLRWAKKCDIESALAWDADGFKWDKYDSVVFHKTATWSFVCKIPFATFQAEQVKVGTSWGLGLYRKFHVDHEKVKYLAWLPTLKNPAAFHVPEKFGALTFQK